MDAMEQGAIDGMQTFDGQLEKMVREGIVTKDDALAYASNQGNLLLRLGSFGAGGPPKPKVEPKPDSMLDMIER
jgi:Tfp pilus assembly ATPase PilU